jgi:hypothetical protein
MRANSRFLALGLATLLVLVVFPGTASLAQAQYQAAPSGYGGYPPPPPPPPAQGVYREGLMLGGGLGLGNISADNCGLCGSGLAWELHIGAMLNPRLAVMADIWGIAHPYTDAGGNSGTMSNSMFTGAVQYWLVPQLWIKGGVGGGHIDLSDANGTLYGTSDNALAVLAAGGFEIVQSGNLALDLQLRIGYVNYTGGGASNAALLVGLNWY